MIHAGATLDGPPDATYAEALDFAEVLLPERLPKLATARAWRDAVPEDFTYAVVAPESCMRAGTRWLDLDGGLRAELEALGAVTKALRAKFTVVRTGPAVTPGQRDRQRLAAYFEAARAACGNTLVWQAGGLWEVEASRAFASTQHVLLAANPTMDPVGPGPTVYARMEGLGAKQRVSDDTLLALVDACADADEAYVVFHSAQSVRAAGRLAALLRGDDADAP